MTARTLKTADLAGGIALSLELARELSGQLAKSWPVDKPGGTNYGEPAPVPVEMIAGILLVAISIANEGWKSAELSPLAGSLSSTVSQPGCTTVLYLENTRSSVNTLSRTGRRPS